MHKLCIEEMFTFALALLGLGFLTTIKDCGVGNQFRLTELAFTPDAPLSGEMTYLTVKFYNPGESVVAGTVTTSITYNFLPLAPTVESLCVNTACPIVNGLNDRSSSSPWPSGVKGQIDTKIVWAHPNASQLLCIQLVVKAKEKSEMEKGVTVNDLFALHKIFHNRTNYMPTDTGYGEDFLEGF
jgi:hypothetical protein